MTVSVWLLLSCATAQEEYPDEAFEGSGSSFEGSESSFEGSGSSDDGDWSCQECRDGSIGVGNFYVQRAQIASQGQHLMDTVNVCGDHPNPGECEAAWPSFWSRMGPLIWRGHFSHMCEDREAECGPSPINYNGNLTMSDSQTRPSCEACYLRVDGALGYLSSEETVNEWVAELETWFDCKEDFSSTEACTDYIRVTMTNILGELEQWKRGSLASEWCQHWGSCTNDELAELNSS